MRTGILGGTFDPVHLGHITIAEQVRDELSLDEVLLIPAGVPMSRPGSYVTPAHHRLAMLKIAVKGRPKLSVSSMEIERPGPTYTVTTLEQLRNKGYAEGELYFVLGSDTLQMLGSWKSPRRIIELSRIVVVPRPGYRQPDDEEIDRIMPGLSERIVHLKGPYLDISASQIRLKIQAGEPVDELVPPGIEAYIKTNNLYRGEAA